MAMEYQMLDNMEGQQDSNGDPTSNLWQVVFRYRDVDVPGMEDWIQHTVNATTVDADTLPQYRTKCEDAVKAYLGIP